jgi:hypothetical protein
MVGIFDKLTAAHRDTKIRSGAIEAAPLPCPLPPVKRVDGTRGAKRSLLRMD